MGIEFPRLMQTPTSLREVPDTKRETWGDLVDLTTDWYGLESLPMVMRDAIEPYAVWVRRIRLNGIPWRQRLSILFTGYLPRDL